MIDQIANHLWQSTLFAAGAALFVAGFRRYRARVRYWLWLAASVKFLVPFALLTMLGSQMDWLSSSSRPQQPLSTPGLASTISMVGEPFNDARMLPVVPAPRIGDALVLGVVAVWLCGVGAIALLRLRGWRRVRAALQSSTPWTTTVVPIPAHVRLRATSGVMEPGVVGIWRPVLLVPADITECLDAPQLKAVLLHELTHVWRRDNLTAAIHMVVEGLFWFHPLVWWIGGRLVDERERACDEAVLCELREPRTYAEGIVNVCRRYVESPLITVSGVGGSSIRTRIHAILANRVGQRLSAAAMCALAIAAIAVLLLPILAGAAKANTPVQSAAAIPAFDVATIKRTPTGNSGDFEPSIVQFMAGGGFRRTNSTLRTLVRTAYGVHPYQVRGGPDWADSTRYDVEARGSQGLDPNLTMSADPNRAQILRMLQTLLTERFQLRVRRETSDGDVYHLVVSERGSRLARVTDSTSASVRIGSYAGRRTTAQLADYLGTIVGRPVADRTGLTGIFDMRLQFTQTLDDPTGVSVFAALREQLGLELKPARGPVEAYVILNAQPPSDN
jgi:uncharacterized protein (TIGR03435 family)